MSASVLPPLWTIECRGEHVEERGDLLYDAGACGIEIIDRNTARCFVEGAESDCAAFRAAAEALGVETAAPRAVPRNNWVQQCAEVWQPVAIGELTLRPILDESEAPPAAAPGELIIIPGAGFGTGHHATTRTVLEFIQRPELAACAHGIALDVGTGSGILALAVSEVWRSLVVACEIDPLAIANARKNMALNRAGGQVLLVTGSLSAITGRFALIVANIYAEVLCSMERDLHARLEPGGMLIVSGIMDTRNEMIDERFSAPAWNPIEQRSVDGWTTRSFRRSEEP